MPIISKKAPLLLINRLLYDNIIRYSKEFSSLMSEQIPFCWLNSSLHDFIHAFATLPSHKRELLRTHLIVFVHFRFLPVFENGFRFSSCQPENQGTQQSLLNEQTLQTNFVTYVIYSRKDLGAPRFLYLPIGRYRSLGYAPDWRYLPRTEMGIGHGDQSFILPRKWARSHQSDKENSCRMSHSLETWSKKVIDRAYPHQVNSIPSLSA
jgi:hypothetical protein